MTPIRVFHIRVAKKSRLSVRVEIFRTVTEFRQAARQMNQAEGLRTRTRGLVADCYGVTVRKRKTRRISGNFAVIRIPRTELTMSTITHEAFHATMRWAARVGLTSVPTNGGSSNITDSRSPISDEERCAIVHDTICRKIVSNLNRYKLLTP